MKILNYIFYLILIVVLFNSCYNPDYNYKWTVKVTYFDGTSDTIQCGQNSFKGNIVYLKLKISENGGLFGSSAGIIPCLIVGCGFYQTEIACGVRKYEILKFDKTKIY